jgi:hypothetical protein
MPRVVAPGAQILLKSIEPYDPSLTAVTMTTEQWIKLADAFHQWPFKPDVHEDETYLQNNMVEDMLNTSTMPTRELSSLTQLLLDETVVEDER